MPNLRVTPVPTHYLPSNQGVGAVLAIRFFDIALLGERINTLVEEKRDNM